MKYFTLDWWNEIQGLDKVENPAEKYNDYYDSVKNHLPSAFVNRVEEISLHDGRVNLIGIVPDENKGLFRPALHFFSQNHAAMRISRD